MTIAQSCSFSSQNYYQTKAQIITNLLSQSNINSIQLQSLCTSPGGLLHDCYRKILWPLIANVNSHNIINDVNTIYNTTSSHLNKNPESHQITLDTSRCYHHLVINSKHHVESKKYKLLLKRKQHQLSNLIKQTLHNTNNNYYQGYHDISSIFLNVLYGSSGIALASEVLKSVTESHFHVYVQNTFEPLILSINCTIYPLLMYLDKELYHKLVENKIEPHFCTSWVITWFSHDVTNTMLVKRLFDVLLVSHDLMVMYISVMLLIKYRELIIKGEDLHQVLQALVVNMKNMDSWEEIIEKSSNLMKKISPDKLELLHMYNKRKNNDIKKKIITWNNTLSQRILVGSIIIGILAILYVIKKNNIQNSNVVLYSRVNTSTVRCDERYWNLLFGTTTKNKDNFENNLFYLDWSPKKYSFMYLSDTESLFTRGILHLWKVIVKQNQSM